MVSVWEIAIKLSIGKLKIARSLADYLTEQLENNGISILSIEMPHVLHVETMAMHHRDPFDRLLIAQSLLENMPIVGVDAIMDSYGVQRLW